jgi:hypothetical protein
VKAALTDQILIRNDRIWTARPRIDHVVIFQASAPRISNAAGLIDLVAAGDLAAAIASAEAEVTASAAVEDLADSAVIASAVAVVALADSAAAAGSGVDGKN